MPVPQTLREPLLEVSPEVAASLRTQSYTNAADTLLLEGVDTIPGQRKGRAAFVTAYALVRADRAQEAGKYIPIFPTDGSIPTFYAAYVIGAVAFANEDMRKADMALKSIAPESAIYPRAALLHADTLISLGRTKDAFAIYRSLADGPLSSEEGAVAMLALSKRAGESSPEAISLMRRIWTEHPFSTAAVQVQSELNPDTVEWTLRERSLRIEQLMLASSYVQALNEGSVAMEMLDAPGLDMADVCRLRYATGRSQYKRKARTKSVGTFGDIGAICADSAPDFGAKGLYLQGMAHLKAGRYAAAVPYFVEIPRRFPTHSYADDGYAMASSAMLEIGDIAGATALVENAILNTPNGDTTPSALIKVAFANYRAGKTQLALDLVDRGALLPLTGDWVHVAGARYWAARWRLYPNPKNPTQITRDEASLVSGKEGLVSLVRDLPWGYYSLLAMGRLIEIAPSSVAGVQRTGRRADLARPWQVRRVLLEDATFMRAVALARLGLVADAMAEWRASTHQTTTAEEFAWVNELRGMGGDWHAAHLAARRSVGGAAPVVLGDSRPEVLRSVYPDRYLQEVREASAPYGFEPRFFHALIREESTFNASVVSWAGAVGLSQVMPATAKYVAKGLGIPYDKSRLVEPAYNLSLGASYLDEVLERFGGSPYLALAAYNAGPYRVETWTKRNGVIPTDEFVELIPFRETRGYVKRVMGSWQLMAWEFDSSVPLPDLSRYNHTHLLPTE
jgi:soluble lytic murein transglycosylase